MMNKLFHAAKLFLQYYMTESIIFMLEPADLKLHTAIFQSSHGVVIGKPFLL